jgi:hypothetical protein
MRKRPAAAGLLLLCWCDVRDNRLFSPDVYAATMGAGRVTRTNAGRTWML